MVLRSWLLIGCWLLAVGCWLLVVGCWMLVVGCWLLPPVARWQPASPRLQHTRPCQATAARGGRSSP
ncbi:MAG: hypothetical protein ACOYOU_11825 [Kiritimatiellia bacterium]